jgi:ribulose 1,5-bisphosphate carboxylase large subunit-like protein
MAIDILRDHRDLSKYFYVTYEVVSSTTLYEAAYGIAVGQSIGNPSRRSVWETPEMIEAYCAKIFRNCDLQRNQGRVEIAYPLANLDWKTDGIAQLLCVIMGGQTDIDIIRRCRVVGLEFDPAFLDATFLKPKHGLSGMREYTGVRDRPFFGGIIKPKTGMTPQNLLAMTKELVDGGVNFIKEDEILSNPAICRLQDRVELISNYIRDTKVVYCFCINADPAYLLPRAKFVAANGGTGVHVNIWSGLGAYKSIREADLGLYIHYQKSGDKVISHPDNAFGISWRVLCQLAAYCGVDTIHAGMWGGYLSDPEDELRETLRILQAGDVVPALSCGLTAELVKPIADKFGRDWMANVGGAIHGDPRGTAAGARKIRQAVDAL